MTQVCWGRVSNQGVNQGQGAKQGARSRCQLCCLSSSSSTSSSLSSSSSSYSSSSSSSYAEARCSIRVSIMLLIGNLLWRPSTALRLQWSLTRHAKMCKSFVFSKFIVCSFLSSDTILASYWSSTEQMWIPIGSSNAREKVRTRSNFVIKKWKQDFLKVESINLNFVSLVLSSEHGASPPQSCLLISDYRNLTMTMVMMMKTLGVTGGWVHSVDSAQQLKRSQSAYLSPVTGRLNWNGKWWRWWSLARRMVIVKFVIMQNISKYGPLPKGVG